MRSMMIAALATATLAAGAFPAGAAEVPQALAKVQSGEVATSYAQWSGRRHVYGGRHFDRRAYYGRPYGYYRRDRGNAAAAGIAGLAAGAIIGGAIAQSQAQAAPGYVVQSDTAAYCAQRFRSYDPASGTYLGYDGLRHPCP
jgi:hypothetical protein